MKKFLLYTILFLALAGAFDAGYLLIETMSSQVVVCPSVPIGRFNLNQCNTVLATSHSKFLGLPVALYGLGAYLSFVILVLCALNGKWPAAKKLLFYLSGFGFLAYLYFIYLQFFVIKAICFYCLISAALMTLIFILSAVYNLEYSASDIS